MRQAMFQLTELFTSTDGYPDYCLSQRCPLMEAARQARAAGLQQQIITELTGDEWLEFLDSTRSYGAAQVLSGRSALILAAMGVDVLGNLRRAVASVQQATACASAEPVAQAWSPASLFQASAVCSRLRRIQPQSEELFLRLAEDYGGWNPALLSTAAGYVHVLAADADTDAEEPAHSVQTWLLFAATDGESEGVVAKLTLQRMAFSAHAAGGIRVGGAMYPDPLSMGCMRMRKDFQLAIQQAWWREILPWLAECDFDICWSLRLASDHGGWNTIGDTAGLRDLRKALCNPLQGPSAGMAFACALRALRLQEGLDPHVAVSADFRSHFSKDDSSQPVGSLTKKLLAELEELGIDEVLTCADDPVFEGLPHSFSGMKQKLVRTRLKLSGLTDFSAIYSAASTYARVANKVRESLRIRSQELLHSTCRPYVRPSLSRRRAGVPEQNEPQEVRTALTSHEVHAVVTGRSDFCSRIMILAPSGLGKSTLLLEAESLIASEPGCRVPLRLGAGPRELSRNEPGTVIQLPSLSDFSWSNAPQELLNELAERLLGSILEDKQTREAWFDAAVRRGDIVFLLDGLDQTSERELTLERFLNADGVRNCVALLSGRPEVRLTRSKHYRGIDWTVFWVEPFDSARILQFWEDAPRLAELMQRKGWEALRSVPVLLTQMKRLMQRSDELRNREAVYDHTLEMLLQHGQQSSQNTCQDTIAQMDSGNLRKLLSALAWEMISLEARHQSPEVQEFTCELKGAEYSEFTSVHEHAIRALDLLNLTTRSTCLEAGRRVHRIAWRHPSFCEWFGGLHLARLPQSEQISIVQRHALDERWAWILRFALSATDRLKLSAAVTTLARTLLEAGAPWLLWNAIEEDRLQLDPELHQLCQWLVHPHTDAITSSHWPPGISAAAAPRPVLPPPMTESTAKILRSMFRTGQEEPWRNRDSRWLHPAWLLVTANLAHPVCREIHEAFLCEFDRRLAVAANRNSQRLRSQWDPRDQGLLQLVPDDILLQLGVLPKVIADRDTTEILQQWPAATTGTCEQRRESFNAGLQELQANYCLCPPLGWEHPHRNAAGEIRDPAESRLRATQRRRKSNGEWVNDPEQLHFLPTRFFLLRTPVTNLQFEAFDAQHRCLRHWQWYRPDLEEERKKLDDHPVVEVTAEQAEMLAIWLTGHGRNGQFQLPAEEDWEACCRAGRDGPEDEFGVPLCNAEQRPIPDASGREQYHALSSHGANFNGNHGGGAAGRGPYRGGTVPTGTYPANGFGLLDMHGQVWELTANSPDTTDRGLRGGAWDGHDSSHFRSSHRFVSARRNNRIGFRLCWTETGGI